MRKIKLLYVFSFIFIFITGLSEPIFAQETGDIQKGSATWYGSRYHGRKTTSGEVYNKNQMTAAHPKLPFGTKVKVTHAGNSKAVVVRINDRGPFGKKGHIIDLSEAAAKKIGLHQSGYAQVEVEVLDGREDHPEVAAIQAIPLLKPNAALPLPMLTYFVVQAGSFADEAKANLESERIKALRRDLSVTLNEELIKGKKMHQVVGGYFNNRAQAENMKAELQKKGIQVLVRQVLVAS
jgi:rare lipoprotein A